MKITDISAKIPGCRVYPGDPVPKIAAISDIAADGCALSMLSLCSHSGTHVDAPAHFLAGGYGADRIPLENCIGECTVTSDVKTAVEIAERGAKRIIFKGTDITADDARRLAGNILLVGTDGLSFGEMSGEQEAVHKILLSAGTVLLEGLSLGEAKCGEYVLVALPLRLAGCDGSPVRAVLLS